MIEALVRDLRFAARGRGVNMRFARRWQAFGAAAIACALAACGSDNSPTAPEMPTVTVVTGPQVLRLTPGSQGSCTAPDGRPFIPLVYLRVVVTRAGTEWIAAAASADAGDVELRFHASGPVVIAGSMPVAGTIKGTAIHNPELLPAAPQSTTRVSFGTDGRTALSGFAFSPSSLTPATGVSGVGTGTVSVSDNDGRSCSGTNFIWGLGSQP